MPLRFSQMLVDPVKVKDVEEAFEALGTLSIALGQSLKADPIFYILPGHITTLDHHLQFIKSALSLMALTAIQQGVDFIQQDTWEVPKTDDRSTGQDPLDGDSLRGGEVDGGAAGTEGPDPGADAG